jgi:hypothetical protein
MSANRSSNTAHTSSSRLAPHKINTTTKPQQQQQQHQQQHLLMKQDSTELQFQAHETQTVNRMATTYMQNLSPPRQQTQSPRAVNTNSTTSSSNNRLPLQRGESKLTPVYQHQTQQHQQYQQNDYKRPIGFVNHNNQPSESNNDDFYDTLRNNNLSQQDFIDQDMVREN